MQDDQPVIYPHHHIPYRVFDTTRRYISYGWTSSFIVTLVFKRHGFRITGSCVRAIRDDTPCPSRCQKYCTIEK